MVGRTGGGHKEGHGGSGLRVRGDVGAGVVVWRWRWLCREEGAAAHSRKSATQHDTAAAAGRQMADDGTQRHVDWVVR